MAVNILCPHVLFISHDGSMYGIYIYANIWGILMVNVTIYKVYIYIAYMDPMGIFFVIANDVPIDIPN